jgi:pyruvate/2-oxoglutarate dehydrogenase complex dihydrolipoamide acyltransferase (E2) component
MIKEVRLPQISEGIETAEIIQVLVKVGDIVKMEQSIMEMETEKATFELPSPVEGKVTEISVKEGQTLKAGELILKVDTEDK